MKMMTERQLRSYTIEGHPPEIVLLIDKMLDKKLDDLKERVDKLYAAYVVVIIEQNRIKGLL